MRLVASEVARILGGGLVGPDAVAEGAGFDSRMLAGREMFVAVRAERDGHDFVRDALARGAAFALCERIPDSLGDGSTVVIVGDTVAALADLARHHRERIAPQIGGRVVAVTGSVGKTSTKDFMVAAVGAAWSPLAASHRSFNNDLGVPVTILSAPEDVRAMVLEMGMRGFGEITRLCEVARPNLGVVTAVADAHTERVGGLEGVARAKAELVAALPPAGTAILNGDDTLVAAMAPVCRGEVLTYGSGDRADVRFEVVDTDSDGRCELLLADRRDGTTARCRVPLPGVHMASNATAAVAAATCTGVPLADAAAAIESASVAPMRMAWRTGPAGLRILDDSYNANPASVRAALHTLASVRARRRVAVLGYMAELADPGDAHRGIADEARRLGIDLVAVGTDLYGIEPVTVEAVAGRFAGADGATALLVKGSRVAGLESLVVRLSSGH